MTDTPTPTPTFGEVIAATLEWCNQIRFSQGQEPLESLPKGERNNAYSCPCGTATGLAVYIYGAFERTDKPRFGGEKRGKLSTPVPDLVQRFITLFDAGELPDLDLHPDSDWEA